MVIDAWKPKTKVINNKQSIIYYYKVNTPYNSNTKVRWVCDDEKCKTPNKIHTISVGHLDEKRTKHNTLKKQICHSCQMSGENNPMFGNVKSLRELMLDDEKYFKLIKRYSDRWLGEKNISHKKDVKLKKNQFIINVDNLEKLIDDGEKLISFSGNNKYTTLKIVCKNGHIRGQKYNSYKRGYRCSECVWETLRIPLEEKNSYEFYKKIVYFHTRISVRKFKDTLNPQNHKRGNNEGEYHLDHKFSISEGFKKGILPKIIGSKINLEYIPNKDNLRKLDKCSIDLLSLLKFYDIYMYD